jgi:flagellar hook assembly protein FlgD
MQHDMPGEEIDIAVEIYTMQGYRVKTLTAHALTSGYSVPPVEWDGRADNGQLLATGLYVYTITVSNQKGVNTSQKQKLMLMR